MHISLKARAWEHGRGSEGPSPEAEK